MNGRFLDSSNARVRRASAVAYAAATAVAVAVWFLAGGWTAVEGSRIADAAFLVVWAIFAWWIVAGLGLRVVRRLDRRSS